MHKPLFIFIPLYLTLTVIANGQIALKAFVHDKAVRISTIEPDSINYDDLELIGKSIGNSKIVMLGEQDHGDAPTFLAKTRLIKYLHERLGFNVLAFESDFFGLNFGWDKLEKSKSEIDNYIRNNIFPIWTYCNTCQNLFYDYIPSTFQTKIPLEIAGFDNQLILNYSSKFLIYYLDSLLESLNISITKRKDYKSEILPLIDSLKYYTFKDTTNYSKCGRFLSEIKNQVTGKLNDDNFWLQVINNLIQGNKQYQLSKIDRLISGNVRDSQMALNLRWLKDVKFSKEKIIVWAANAHVAKYMDSSGKINKRMISMGAFFTNDEKLLNETYVIGFTSYKGEAGRLGFKTYSIRKPKRDGFENWIPKSDKYSFVDFRTYHKGFPDKSDTFYLKGLGHNSAFKKDWTRVFDGVFFIRDMYPCRKS